MKPAMRQNFAYAFAETHNLNLEVCLIGSETQKLQPMPKPLVIIVIVIIIIS